jgi:hypothetical protein
MSPAPPLRYLLPHERWLAARMLAVPVASQTSRLASARARYGQEGLQFCAATLADTLVGVALGPLVPVLLLAGLAWRPLVGAALWVAVAAGLFMAMSLARGVQAEVIGRKHRGSSGRG